MVVMEAMEDTLDQAKEIDSQEGMSTSFVEHQFLR